MPRKKLENVRRRVGVYLEERLLDRFHRLYDEYGDFTSVMNELLEKHLEEKEKKNDYGD